MCTLYCKILCVKYLYLISNKQLFTGRHGEAVLKINVYSRDKRLVAFFN